MQTPENDNKQPVFNLPPVVQALCLANVAVFLLQYFFPQLLTDDFLYKLSFVPARYFGPRPFDLSALASPITHMFIHSGWLHLIMNVVALMAFGAGVEKNVGGRRVLVLYFAAGIGGALLQALFFPHEELPMVGASGGVSGLFGAVIMMLYKRGAMGGAARLAPVIAAWIGASVFFGFFGMPGVDNPVAWATHIGGFMAGLLLYAPVSRMKSF